MKKINRITSFLFAVLMLMTCTAGCGNSEEDASAESTEYSGVLSRIRLGMPQSKVLSLNNQEEVFYESDAVIWCINPDTDIMEIRDIIPADNGYYFCDESVVTYNFEQDENDGEYYLDSYSEESKILLDRELASQYYEDKVKSLAAKYKCGNYVTNQLGTEGVDEDFTLETVMTLSSFSVVTDMTYTYTTVNGVEGYYGSHFKITISSVDNVQAVVVSEVKSGSGEDEEE